ncbi:L10-interacting MYB domain-containing protein-like [Humulus lupulus]|uniref:L10-interacting MYB domain-containing protein-like n=1 Tax=Humulus lupulus TaxID=3486 RepID=UPI002B415CFA|nr:L10-interacting MYB domain-containing protein-like [Humulus lupulus]
MIIDHQDPELDVPQQAMESSRGTTLRNNPTTGTYGQEPMDRYFIDLMLEQVRKGNTTDGLFRNQAWIEMSASFESMFGINYGIVVLKHRYRTLRRQFTNFIKNLLNFDGFVWDETQQIFTADNKVWQDYIKAHGEIPPFMTKPIPYYRDLCVLWGPRCDERESSSGEDQDTRSPATPVSNSEHVIGDVKNKCQLEMEKSLLSSDKETTEEVTQRPSDQDYGIFMASSGGTTLSDRTRTHWQEPMDRYFIDLLLEQVRKGNIVDGIFQKQAWIEMSALFDSMLGMNYGMVVLKNRYRTLRTQFNFIKNLLLYVSGFVWDRTQHMVVAIDEVWEKYIKVHGEVPPFMDRPMPYFKDLCDIFDPNFYEREICFGEDQDTRSPTTTFSYGVMSEENNQRHDQFQSEKSQEKDKGIMATRAVSFVSDNKKVKKKSIPIEKVIEAVQALPEDEYKIKTLSDC